MASLKLSSDSKTLVHNFFALKQPDDVAQLLDISYKNLIYYLYRLTQEEKYRRFTVKKRCQGLRELVNPNPGLKIIQQKLNQILNVVFRPRPSVHGFTPNRSIATNAQLHEGQKYILNIDLKDFFPSINFGRVRGMFMAFPYNLPPRVATILAQICCYDNGLPQGAPTSPIVSNMICSKLDSELQRLAKRRKCTYSRYADDITFSTSADIFPNMLATQEGLNPSTLIIGDELKEVIEKNGFRINEEKTRFRTNSQRLEVTGLIVNKRVNVERRYVRQIRSMLHAWKKFGPELAEKEYYTNYANKSRAPFYQPATFPQIVKGKLNFLAMVRGNNDPIYLKLLKWYSELDGTYQMPPLGLRMNHLTRFEDGIWVIEGFKQERLTVKTIQGTGFFLEGYGLVTCEHVVVPGSYAYRPSQPNLKYPVKIISKSYEMDLAILDIEAPRHYEFKALNLPLPIQGDSITVAGFPEYAPGATLWVHSGTVTGYRRKIGYRRIVVDCPIKVGASGGPAMDAYKRVVGIIATGAPEFPGFIPVSLLANLPRNQI